MYFSNKHHTKNYGYQNPEVAKQFAEFVVSKVEELFPNQPVTIIGIDNSSTFLAAFVKMLRPEWFLISGSKHSKELKNKYLAPKNAKLVFVDDFLCGGRATGTLLDILKASDLADDLTCFYIQASSNAIEDKIQNLKWVFDYPHNLQGFVMEMEKTI